MAARLQPRKPTTTRSERDYANSATWKERTLYLNTDTHTAIKTAWEHGGAEFQSRIDKSTAQAERIR